MITPSRFTCILRCLIFALITGLFAPTAQLRAQVAASQQIEVTAEPLPSAYGAPTSFSQSRFAPLTNAYVLPPGASLYELSFMRTMSFTSATLITISPKSVKSVCRIGLMLLSKTTSSITTAIPRMQRSVSKDVMHLPIGTKFP